MPWTDLIDYIGDRIYTNGNNEITAIKNNEAFVSLVNRTHNAFPQGVATVGGSPSLDGDSPRWWLATRGTYTNYGNLVIESDLAVIIYRNGWTKHELNFKQPQVFEVTGLTDTTFKILNATVEDHSIRTNVQMDMIYCQVKRGTTYLSYNKNSPNRMEYYAVQNGSDVDITLGRLPQVSDVFRIKLS